MLINQLSYYHFLYCRYSITKVRLKKLEQYRNRKGKFNNLETPLEVDGFGIKVLDKFYKSVLDERDNKKPTEKVVKGKKRNLGFLTPPLDENIRKVLFLLFK